ncbi:MAG: hypothetical protein BAJALOKI2v1_140005 [Promethearchaeota archaeon]|nr:MAG: hypothetical protein BAJALOKI2v1_140005 [Candidatus Lokiarchaeota archaeon]
MENEKKEGEVSKVGLGMLFGVIFGAILGTLIFIFTQNALSFSIIGIFLALGLAFGTAWEDKSS